MTDIAYDSAGHVYTPLDRDTALRYARKAEDRYQPSDLPDPDLEPGECSECGHDSHVRWHHGTTDLCRKCRRRRQNAGIERALEPLRMSIRIPRFAGLCQRCITDEATILEIVAHLFLCPFHGKRARRAQRAARARTSAIRNT